MFGIEPEVVMKRLFWLIYKADTLVAHNISFDIGVILAEAYRVSPAFGKAFAKMIENKNLLCTMAMSREICEIPPTKKMLAAGFTAFKPPTVAEALKKLLDKDLENAHNALYDTRGVKDIFFEMKRLGDLEDELDDEIPF